MQIGRPRPPDTYPPIHAAQGGVSPIATGMAGAIVGGLVGAGYMASRKLSSAPDDAPAKKSEG